MGQIEHLFRISKSQQTPVFTTVELVAREDALNSGTLNEFQRKTVRALREEILLLVNNEQNKV
jgi:hypothetical protein